MAFLTPLALLGGLLAVPIILLYMLRLRRREVVVSSTFLWQQVVRDSEANTPWQKLRRNLLLILQLLILALLVLALMRPFIIVPAVSAGQIELLLDASASMNATDTPDGITRFEAARAQALSMVDTLGAGDTMTVIRVSNVPEVLVPRTGDANLLRQAINAMQPGQAAADWVAAFTLAVADAAGAQDFNLVVVSDGGLGAAEGLPGVPGTVRYLPVGQSGDNLAITALSARALPGQPPQLFAQITNYGAQDAAVIFDLRVDGALHSAERLTVPAGSSLPVISTDLPADFQTVQAGLTLPAGAAVPDYLALDDRAWTVNSTGGERRVLLMSAGNLFLEQALRSLSGIEAFQGDPTRPLPAEAYDLYIFDGWLPADGVLPQGDLLFINPPQDTSLFKVGAESSETGAISVLSNDARTAFVDFGSVNILKFRPVTADWATPLVSAAGGALLLAGETDGRQAAILTFDLHDSDLPLQITWPILMANLMDWFTPRSAVNVPDGLHVGDSLSVRPPAGATQVRVTLPDGGVRDLPVERGTVVFADTNAPGLYRVDLLAGEQVLQSVAVAVNLFSPLESAIAPREQITLSGATIQPAAPDAVGQQEFWPLAALLALVVLLVEWWAYQWRMQAPTVFQPIFRRPKVIAR